MEEPTRVERAAALLTELFSMRGLVPREMQYEYERAMNVRLPVSFFAPVYRPLCTHVKRNGQQCTAAGWYYEGTLCGTHARSRELREQRANQPPKPKCTQRTARGEECKYGRMPGSTACKRHAKRDGLLPEIPTECAICYEEMTEEQRFQTGCFHHFHKECMGRWVTQRRASFERVSCPMCRAPVRAPSQTSP